jgi:hypothetical protein
MREVASRQLQPLVYCHGRRTRFGPAADDAHGNPGLGDEVEFTYYLSNEGLGPALNVEHGVELEGELHLFGYDGGFQFRTARAGEFLPPLEPNATHPVPERSIAVYVPNSVYWRGRERDRDKGPQPLYFCRFEGLFGERWETRNPSDPRLPPDIRRLG